MPFKLSKDRSGSIASSANLVTSEHTLKVTGAPDVNNHNMFRVEFGSMAEGVDVYRQIKNQDFQIEMDLLNYNRLANRSSLLERH